MPQVISCPDCGRKLRVPDNLLGKKVKCPGCGVKFAAQAEEVLDELEEIEPLPPPSRPRDEGVVEKPSKSRRGDDEEEDDDDLKRQKPQPKKKDIYKGWERVLFGLNLVAISIWIWVGARIVSFIAAVLLSSAVSAAMSSGTAVGPGAYTLTNALFGLAALTDLICLMLQIAGFGFCTGVAITQRTLGLKILALVMSFMAIGSLVAAAMFHGAGVMLGQRGAFIVGVAGLAMVLLSFGEGGLFLFFMRGVALVMRKEDLARAVVTFMIIIAACIGLFVIAILVLVFAGMVATDIVGASPGAPPGSGRHAASFAILTCGASLLVFGVSIALLIRFMSLLYQLRSTVSQWLDRN
jgi:hypothetical protein